MLDQFEQNEKRVYGYSDIKRSTMFIENMKTIKKNRNQLKMKPARSEEIRPFEIRL